jgi:hypothetical protein
MQTVRGYVVFQYCSLSTFTEKSSEVPSTINHNNSYLAFKPHREENRSAVSQKRIVRYFRAEALKQLVQTRNKTSLANGANNVVCYPEC